jgi:glyceraldehyde 3-phosphate dehydrogenase
MAVNVGINGFGRIGRNAFRAQMKNKDINVVAVNDLTDPAALAHMLKYDSTYGVLDASVSSTKTAIKVAGKTIKVLSERDPANLPWGDLGVDVVIESTGFFTARAAAAKHIEGGAKKVIISAPAKEPDHTIVIGVNDKTYNPKKHHIISNASCTTNCLAPVAKVIHEKFGIVSGLMCTVHSYTGDQRLLDAPHKDYRRMRSAAVNIIPTTTGAAKAVGLVLPAVQGKLTGYALRVPTVTVSVVDLSVVTKKKVTVEDVNGALEAASKKELKGILGFETQPLVSTDFQGCPLSSIVDPAMTLVINDNHVKLVSWYDNEMGYSNRIMELAAMVGKKLS